MMSFKPPLLRQLVFALAAAAAFVPSVTIAKPPVPFKAIIAISETLVPGSCLLNGAISGTGQASHLGRINLGSLDCITPPLPGSGSAVFSFSSARIVITAANGDEIFGTYEGTLDATSGIGVVDGIFVIKGGTGRFLNATGRGSIQGLEAIDFANGIGQGQIQLNGTISF
jgi:hypothetical protein